MQTQKLWFIFLGCMFVMFYAGTSAEISAQPSDAQIKKDLSGPKTVSVTLGSPGKLEWSKTFKKYVWNRSFTAKVKSDYPDIFVIVKGYATYDVMAGRYVFSRAFTTSNNYEGIPDPTAADVRSLISKFGAERFVGNYDFRMAIGGIESIVLAPNPKIVWHTPNSVSFNVVAVFTRKTNNIGGSERIARTYEIRVYRDAVKADWKNIDSTPRGVEKL